jgi:hypothetical protein
VNDSILKSRSSILSSLRSVRKDFNARTQLDNKTAISLDYLEEKVTNLFYDVEAYKSRLSRELGRENKKLKLDIDDLIKENQKLRSEKGLPDREGEIEPDLEKQIATSISVFETLLDHICGDSNDYRLICYSILFPSVYERINECRDEYLFDKLPDVAMDIVNDGKKELEFIRQDCNTYLTDDTAWGYYIDRVNDWWKKDALVRLFDGQDTSWEIDEPYSFSEMRRWDQQPECRAMDFVKIDDVFNIYKLHRKEVFTSSGIQDFEMDIQNMGQSTNFQFDDDCDEENQESTWIKRKFEVTKMEEKWAHAN